MSGNNALASRASKRLTGATPLPAADDAPKARETASAAPSADPGPPPQMPFFSGSHTSPALELMMAAARARDRDSLRAVDTLRHPPGVGRYKANLLHWLDELDAYEARK